eukprot:Gb_17697 [translate_table: standard]
MASTDNGGRFMEAPSINSLSRTGSQTISVRTSASPVGNKSSNNANRSGPNAISTASKSLAFASNRSPVTGSGVDETPQAGNSHYSINNSSSGGNNTTSTNNNASTPSGKQSTATGQGLHNSLLRVGPRLRAEGLMVPPASDAATLRRQVAGLQSDLQAHIESEQRLQNINQQLRERGYGAHHSEFAHGGILVLPVANNLPQASPLLCLPSIDAPFHVSDLRRPPLPSSLLLTPSLSPFAHTGERVPWRERVEGIGERAPTAPLPTPSPLAALDTLRTNYG